jgi:hypothetical protein
LKEKEQQCSDFFNQLDVFYKALTKDHPQALIITGGDFNARVGTYDERHKAYCGRYGLSANNYNGDLLVKFCKQNRLCIPGTFFPHKKLHTVSWCHPRFKAEDRWQSKGILIDHFLVPIKCRKGGLVRDVRTRYRKNAAANYLQFKSDHRLQVMKLEGNIMKHPARPPPQTEPRPIPMNKRFNVCMDPSKEEGRETMRKVTDKYLEIVAERQTAAGYDDEDEDVPADPPLTPAEALDQHIEDLSNAVEYVCCKSQEQAREERRRMNGITKETIAESKQRDLLYKAALRRDKDPQASREERQKAWKEWKAQCRQVKRLVKMDIREHLIREMGDIETFHEDHLYGEVWNIMHDILKLHNITLPTPPSVEDETGKMLHGHQSVADRFARYYEERLNLNDTDTSQIQVPPPTHDLSIPLDPLPPPPPPPPEEAPLLPPQDEPLPSQGPFVLKEIQLAIRQLKNKRAGDKKGAIAEIFKVGLPVCGQELTDTLNAIRTSHQVPDSWKELKIKALYKRKGKRSKCTSHRPIFLVDIAYKIMAQVCLRRLNQVVEPMLLDEHNGFMKGRSISDAIHALQRMAEQFRKLNQPLFCAFLDLKQAYDSVPRKLLFRIMKVHYNVDPELVDLIEALYKDTQGRVHVEQYFSLPFPLNTGVKQGCSLSPLLFTIFIDFVLRQALPVMREHGVKLQYTDDLIYSIYQGVPTGEGLEGKEDRIYTRIITALLYADDIAIVSRSQEGLTIMLSHLNDQLRKHGISLCMEKSNYMNIATLPNHPQIFPPIILPGGSIEYTQEILYLGTVIAADGTATANIKRRIRLGWHAYYLHSHFLRRRKMSMVVRDTVFQVSVVAVLLYGSENWVLSKSDLKSLNEAHTRMITAMLRISYADRKGMPYAERRARFCNTPSVEDLLRRRQLRYAGHLFRMHERQPRLPSMTLAGRPDPTVHPTNGTAGEKIAKSWADQLKSHIFIELGTRCNHRSALTNARIRRDIKEKMRNKAGWANICKEAGRRENKRANRRCPDCGYHFISSIRMESHRQRRHQGGGVQDNVDNVE